MADYEENKIMTDYDSSELDNIILEDINSKSLDEKKTAIYPSRRAYFSELFYVTKVILTSPYYILKAIV